MSITNRFSTVLDSAVEMHSLQDGLVIGTVLALSIHYPPAITLIAAILGLQGSIKPRKLLSRADEIVRVEDIQEAPEYFLVGFLGSAIIVSAIVMGALRLGLLEFVPL